MAGRWSILNPRNEQNENFQPQHPMLFIDNCSLWGCIRKNWNNTEKISMPCTRMTCCFRVVDLRVSIFIFYLFLVQLNVSRSIHCTVSDFTPEFAQRQRHLVSEKRCRVFSRAPSERVIDLFCFTFELYLRTKVTTTCV
jgi:hypothetical protein